MPVASRRRKILLFDREDEGAGELEIQGHAKFRNGTHFDLSDFTFTIEVDDGKVRAILRDASYGRAKKIALGVQTQRLQFESQQSVGGFKWVVARLFGDLEASLGAQPDTTEGADVEMRASGQKGGDVALLATGGRFWYSYVGEDFDEWRRVEGYDYKSAVPGFFGGLAVVPLVWDAAPPQGW